MLSLDDVIANEMAQRIRLPPSETKNRLLPPWTLIASCLGAHPSCLAPLVAEQPIKNAFAYAATRSCENNGWMRALTSHSDLAKTPASLQLMLPKSMTSESW